METFRVVPTRSAKQKQSFEAKNFHSPKNVNEKLSPCTQNTSPARTLTLPALAADTLY